MAKEKTTFKLESNQVTEPKAQRSANLFMWGIKEHPDYHPFANIVVEGENIVSMSFSIPVKDMEDVAVHMLKMVKSKRLKK